MREMSRFIVLALTYLLFSSAIGLGQSIVVNALTPSSGTAFAPDTVTVNFAVKGAGRTVRFLVDGREITRAFVTGTHNWTTTFERPGAYTIELADADNASQSVSSVYHVAARFSIFGLNWSYFRPAAVAGFDCTMGNIGKAYRASFDSASTAGFQMIIGEIPRIDVSKSRWSEIKSQIAWAKAQRWGNNRMVKWLYVDDGQDHNGIDADSISVRQIDSVGHLAHMNGFKLASSSWDVRLMRTEHAWWDSVDVVFPYSYMDTTVPLYTSFLQSVHDLFPDKVMVPGVGYHAAVNVSRPAWNYNFTAFAFYKSQLGDSAGHAGLIEVAEKYATEGIVSYYISCENWDRTWPAAFDSLVTYLQSYYYLKAGISEAR